MIRRGCPRLALVAALAGCLSVARRPVDGEEPPGAARAAPTATRTIILRGERLWGEAGVLLDAIERGVAGTQIQRAAPCPKIALRGSTTGATNPAIYLDGALVGNTCILTALRPADVERVEIYPIGVSPHPGYGTSAHGLILIFLRHS